jgi:hypothetical protein
MGVGESSGREEHLENMDRKSARGRDYMRLNRVCDLENGLPVDMGVRPGLQQAFSSEVSPWKFPPT